MRTQKLKCSVNFENISTMYVLLLRGIIHYNSNGVTVVFY